MEGQPVEHAASSGGTNHLASAVELGPMQEKWDPVEWQVTCASLGSIWLKDGDWESACFSEVRATFCCGKQEIRVCFGFLG